MSDKQHTYSLAKALKETLTHGSPVSGLEAETHYELARAREAMPNRGEFDRGTRGHSVFAPWWAFRRDLGAGQRALCLRITGLQVRALPGASLTT
jgi:hypothetical protein